MLLWFLKLHDIWDMLNPLSQQLPLKPTLPVPIQQESSDLFFSPTEKFSMISKTGISARWGCVFNVVLPPMQRFRPSMASVLSRFADLSPRHPQPLLPLTLLPVDLRYLPVPISLQPLFLSYFPMCFYGNLCWFSRLAGVSGAALCLCWMFCFSFFFPNGSDFITSQPASPGLMLWDSCLVSSRSSPFPLPFPRCLVLRFYYSRGCVYGSFRLFVLRLLLDSQ